MATWTANYGGYVTLKVTATEVEVNIANNTSKVRVESSIYYGGGTTAYNYDPQTLSVSVNGSNIGTQTGITYSLNSGATKTLNTYTSGAITHNEDGSKSVNVTVNIADNISHSARISQTLTLTEIARASTLNSFGNFTVKNNETTTFSLEISRASYTFTHNIYLLHGSETIQSWTGQGLPTSLTVSSSASNRLLNIMRDKTSSTVKLRVQTMSGNTKIGGVLERNATVYVSSSENPSISSITIDDSQTAIKTKFGTFIQGKSTLNVSVATISGYGARDNSLVIDVDGRRYTSKNFTTPPLINSGDLTLTATFTNTRGQVVKSSKVITVQPYSNPNPVITSIYRSNESGLKDDEGLYGTVEFKGSISPISNKNTKLFRIQHKRVDRNIFTETEISSTVYNVSQKFTFPANIDYGYEVRFIASDYFGERIAYADLQSTFSLLNFPESGKGVSFGGTYDEKLGGIAQFYGDIFYDGVLLKRPTSDVIPGGSGNGFISSPHLSKVDGWADSYFKFIEKNTGNFENISVNPVGLVGASFNLDNPNTSYTPPTTSTSEAQLLVIRGLLRNYIATREEKWRLKAEHLTTALLRYYYPYENIPTTIDEQWIPHWLVNVVAPFRSREYFLDSEATFVNGVATVNYPMVHKIWSARPMDSIPLYTWTPDPPFSKGTYAIEKSQVFYGQSKAIITLKDKTFNGKALISHSSETGRTIDIGEKCEAFPVWRPLDGGEIACAVDALPWALDVFEMWHEITGEAKWQHAIASTKEALRVAMTVTNTEYYIKGKQTGERVLANGVTSFSTKEPKETYVNRNGMIVIDYPEATGEASFGAWVGDRLEFSNDKYMEVSIGSNKRVKASILIDEDSDYDPNKRWRSDIWLSGNGLLFDNMEKITLKPSDFYDATKVFWGEAYGKNHNGDPINSGQSSVVKTQKFGSVNGKNKPYTNINLTRGDEGGWLGWAQLMLGVWGESLPFDFSYKTNSAIDFVITDSAGTRKTYRLPKTGNSFKTISLTEATFGGLASGIYQSVILEAIDSNSVIDVEYIGTLKKFNKDYMTSVNFEYSGSERVQIGIEYIKPAPSRTPLKYSPYILPFDYHLINYEVSNLRGAIYTGYQVPWLFQHDLFENSSEALAVNLQFLQDSQVAYEKMIGVKGFFAPIYWWNYREDYGENEPDTFGIVGNWGDIWGGFQYRTISDVARVFEKDPHNLKAKQIFINFVKAVDNHWEDTARGFPTAFVKGKAPYNDQIDSHMVTNFLRSLLYGLKSENLNGIEEELVYKLIKKCLVYLDYWFIPVETFQSPVEGTWSPDVPNKTWFNYWGGDILDCLGMLRMLIK